SRKKKDASPSNASTKQSAACIRFGNVAAASAPASVKTEMIMNTMLFIQRNDKHAARISFAYPARSTSRCKQPQSRRETTAIHAKPGVLKSRIFGHVSGNDFRFALRHVEGSAVRFDKTGDEKQNECSGAPRREDKPARHDAKCVFALRGNDRVRYERTDCHHY